jgi:hypothetical protein
MSRAIKQTCCVCEQCHASSTTCQFNYRHVHHRCSDYNTGTRCVWCESTRHVKSPCYLVCEPTLLCSLLFGCTQGRTYIHTPYIHVYIHTNTQGPTAGKQPVCCSEMRCRSWWK